MRGMKEVVIYTDGACRGNPGPGGWAAILIFEGDRKEVWGACADTTNNRMELTAAIEALGTLKERCAVEMHTDSTYVQQGMKSWLAGWKARGWRTANKKPVKNVDLWRKLDGAAGRHEVAWHWVKGHDMQAENERCDELANRALDEMLEV